MRNHLSREEFYRLRDDRTDRYVQERSYRDAKCLLFANERVASSFAGQVMILTAANLLSRWCRRIDLYFPDQGLHDRLTLNGWQTLHQRVTGEVRDADPFGEFRIVREPVSRYDFRLQVGTGSASHFADFIIDGGGWLAYGYRRGSVDITHHSLNPVGPAVAACLGVAQVFKQAIGQPEDQLFNDVVYSAFDLALKGEAGPEMPTHIDLGRTQMIGVGSVGSAVLYFLKMLPVVGSLTLIDHDIVKIENLNRSPLFGISSSGQNKSDVGRNYLLDVQGLDVQSYPIKYSEFIRRHGRQLNSVDLLLSLANEDHVRWTIENNEPPLMIYGTTTRDWGLNFGRHIPLQEDCLVCRYPEDGQEVQLVCAEGQIETQAQQQIDAALPFLSVLAAALVVSEVIGLQLKGYPFHENFAFIDLKNKLERVIKYNRRPKPNCLCSQRTHPIFEHFNGKTKFAGLSRSTQEALALD